MAVWKYPSTSPPRQLLLLTFWAVLVSQLLAPRQVGGHPLGDNPQGYLSSCLLARDGNRDIREWVEYHLFAGFDKIFLFDHNSSVPMMHEVSDYVAEGKVQYTYFTSQHIRPRWFGAGLQGRVFEECMALARGYYTWMAFTDLDEFIMVTDPKYNHSIPAVLREHEDAGAVMVHWLHFGSAGVQERAPGQEVLPTFTKCTGRPNVHVKSIVQLEYATLGHTPHNFGLKNGKASVRAGDWKVVSGPTHDQPTQSPLSIYHYSKSVSEYTARVNKLGKGVSGFTNKNMAIYHMVDAESKHDCPLGRAAHALMPRRPKPDCDCAHQGGDK